MTKASHTDSFSLSTSSCDQSGMTFFCLRAPDCIYDCQECRYHRTHRRMKFPSSVASTWYFYPVCLFASPFFFYIMPPTFSFCQTETVTFSDVSATLGPVTLSFTSLCFLLNSRNLLLFFYSFKESTISSSMCRHKRWFFSLLFFFSKHFPLLFTPDHCLGSCLDVTGSWRPSRHRACRGIRRQELDRRKEKCLNLKKKVFLTTDQ